MNIADLKRAKDAGATHIDDEGRLYKSIGKEYCILWLGHLGMDYYKDGRWYALGNKTPIDFTPLNDYYADKELDIRATGEGE